MIYSFCYDTCARGTRARVRKSSLSIQHSRIGLMCLMILSNSVIAMHSLHIHTYSPINKSWVLLNPIGLEVLFSTPKHLCHVNILTERTISLKREPHYSLIMLFSILKTFPSFDRINSSWSSDAVIQLLNKPLQWFMLHICSSVW